MKLSNKTMHIIALVVALVANAAPGLAAAADKQEFATTPTSNSGKKWRIGYFEGGPYTNYQQTLAATVRGLMKLGWIATAELPAPPEDETTSALWQWLAAQQSEYVEFVSDAHYSANWDDADSERMSTALTERLNTERDINLVIAMGTRAAKKLANNNHATPTLVMSTSDPISTGIIKSVEDSGFDHVHAGVDPRRFERQLLVFHEAIGFKKLGVAFEDTVNGRSYAAMHVVDRLSLSRGFDVATCHTQSDVSDTRVAEASVIECFNKLATEVDAIYLTQQGGVTKRSIPKLIAIANEHKIPTFSQTGSREVALGVLMSLSRAAYRYVGEFNAATMAKVMNGAKPNQIDQLFEEPPKIAINLRSAEIIGFDPPVVLLGAADEIFNQIETAQ